MSKYLKSRQEYSDTYDRMKGTPFTAHTLEIKSVNIKQYGKERISNFKRNQRSNTGTY